MASLGAVLATVIFCLMCAIFPMHTRRMGNEIQADVKHDPKLNPIDKESPPDPHAQIPDSASMHTSKSPKSRTAVIVIGLLLLVVVAGAAGIWLRHRSMSQKS